MSQHGVLIDAMVGIRTIGLQGEKAATNPPYAATLTPYGLHNIMLTAAQQASSLMEAQKLYPDTIQPTLLISRLNNLRTFVDHQVADGPTLAFWANLAIVDAMGVDAV